MERLNKIHINYKEWEEVRKLAKENGINTFAELEMYCKIHNVKTKFDLFLALSNDYVEIAYEHYIRQVNKIYLKGM